MNELMLFDEPKVDASGSDRLIVVVLPPPLVARELGELGLGLQQDHFLRGSARPTSHLHLTMFHVGDFAGLRDDILASARRACAAAALRSQKFHLQVDRASCNGKRERGNPLVLTPEEKNILLIQLYQRLVLQFDQERLRDQRPRFSPHLTLAYVDGALDKQIQPVSWIADEIVLIHSRLGKTQYIPLGRWKLSA